MNLQTEITESLALVNAFIDSRFRGSRIATGKHVAKVSRRIDRRAKIYELRGMRK
jgi:hypothetical protein